MSEDEFDLLVSERFEFTVEKVREWEDDTYAWRGNYRVYLPHQCDSWVVAGDNGWSGDPLPAVIADMREFIAEAQAALAVLESESKQVPDPGNRA